MAALGLLREFLVDAFIPSNERHFSVTMAAPSLRSGHALVAGRHWPARPEPSCDGFEHSIANLYLLPYALAIKAWAGSEFWAAIGQGAMAYPELTPGELLHNAIVATIGNLVGDNLMLGAICWFCVERERAA